MTEHFRGFQELADEPPEAPPPEGAVEAVTAARFKLERWSEITFEPRGEWLIKKVLPRRGLAAIYGK